MILLVIRVWCQPPPQECHITDRPKAILLTWFSVLLVLVSVSALFSPSMCLDKS